MIVVYIRDQGALTYISTLAVHQQPETPASSEELSDEDHTLSHTNRISYTARDRSGSEEGSSVGDELIQKCDGLNMPSFNSYSKAALEIEYFNLHALCQAQQPSSGFSPPPTLPKTKTALLNRVMKLWQSLYDPEGKTSIKSTTLSQASAGKKPKKIAVPKKKKLSPEGIDDLLSHVCTQDPQFYMRLLRYEVSGHILCTKKKLTGPLFFFAIQMAGVLAVRGVSRITPGAMMWGVAVQIVFI